MERLEERYKDILAVCQKISFNNKDLPHEVVLKIYDNPYILDETRTRFMGWVFIVAKNIHTDELRKQSPVLLVADLPEIVDEYSKLDPFECYERIMNSNLSEIEKLWIDAYIENDCSPSETADKLGIHRKTVWYNIKKIKKKLNE